MECIHLASQDYFYSSFSLMVSEKVGLNTSMTWRKLGSVSKQKKALKKTVKAGSFHLVEPLKQQNEIDVLLYVIRKYSFW